VILIQGLEQRRSAPLMAAASRQAPARTHGYDALSGAERLQIKGRAYGQRAKPGQKRSTIKTDSPCDTVLLPTESEVLGHFPEADYSPATSVVLSDHWPAGRLSHAVPPNIPVPRPLYSD
jgi:hypothetical protein